MTPSPSQVKHAGSLVRKAVRGTDVNFESLQDAIETIEAHRATFKAPLVTANNGLRSMVNTLRLEGKVTQRLKRMGTIIDKMQRLPSLSLDLLQDIGGCRVVLPSLDDVYALVKRILKKKTIVKVNDYIEKPRSSGYRCIHLIIEYGKDPRPIEVQVRTERMHRRATMVEEVSGDSGINYKQDGESSMQRFFECLARVLECQELQANYPPGLLEKYDRLINEAFGRQP